MLATLPALAIAACISSPLEVEDSATVQSSGLEVAPATVWLSVGDSQTLYAWLEGEEGDDSLTVTWTSLDPGIAVVDETGTVRAMGKGTTKIDVTAEKPGNRVGQLRRSGAVTVTVTDDAQEASIASILRVPRLESVWQGLAFTRRYDSMFNHYAEPHFERTGGQWEFTYYDRGLAWYAAWWRTGEAHYLERASGDVTAYRDDYVLANDGRATPKWVFPEGLAVHYLLTGDAKSLEAVVKMADHMERSGWLDNTMDTRYRDGRIQGRAILVQIVAYQLTGDGSYKERARRGIEGLMKWYESSGSNGSWDHPTSSDISYCGGAATFQIAHAILEALIRFNDVVETDSRIIPIVEASLDYSWSYWTPGEGFAYIQPPESFTGDVFECDRAGSSRPAKDVSLLIATTFGDAYRLTGDTKYRDRGDEVLEFGLSGALHLLGYKQFNQSFFRSWRYPYFTN